MSNRSADVVARHKRKALGPSRGPSSLQRGVRDTFYFATATGLGISLVVLALAWWWEWRPITILDATYHLSGRSGAWMEAHGWNARLYALLWTFTARMAGVFGALMLAFSWKRRRIIAQAVTDLLWRVRGIHPSTQGRLSPFPGSGTFFVPATTVIALAFIAFGLTRADLVVLGLIVLAVVRTILEGFKMRRESDAETLAAVGARAAGARSVAEAEEIARRKAEADARERDMDYKVFVGFGEGIALARGHAAGIGKNAKLYLGTRDLCEHVLIEGRSGGGKTMAAMLPFMRDMFETRVSGAFVISSKHNFTRQVARLAQTHGPHDVAVIGPDDLTYGIGAGVKPAAWGNIVQQAFDLNAGGKGSDAFFGPNSVLRVRHAAGILCGIDGDTTPKEIRDYIFAPAAQRAKVQEDAEALAGELAQTGERSDRERADWILDALDFERGAWTEIEKADKTKAGVLGQINTVFDALATRALDRAFGRVENGANLSDLLAGKVIILDIDRDAHGKYAASLVALCMFAQFDRFMSDRLRYPASDLRRRIPVAFIVDEYADCVSPQHVEFFRKARESMVAGICALQGDDVMLQGLRGDRATMSALLSLFSQQIVLPVKDAATIERVSKWFSKGEQVKHASSYVEGDSETWGQSDGSSFGPGGSSNSSRSSGGGKTSSFTESLSTNMEEIFTSQQFAELKVIRCDDGRGGMRPEWFQAVFTGFVAGIRKDDVVSLYVDDEIFDVAIS